MIQARSFILHRLVFRIMEQCLNQMPEGDISTDDAKCVPPSRHEMKVNEPSLRAIYTSDRELQNITCVQLFEKEKLEVEIREEIVKNPFPCFELDLYFCPLKDLIYLL